MSPGLLVSARRFSPHSMGAQIPLIVEKPLAVSGCRKFKIDTLGDHLCTCTAHSGVKKVHDWSVGQLVDLFAQHIQQKLNRWLEARDNLVGMWN